MTRLLDEMKAEIRANQETLKAKIKAISDKFEVLRENGPVKKKLKQKQLFSSPGWTPITPRQTSTMRN
jgi:hypothetical protein